MKSEEAQWDLFRSRSRKYRKSLEKLTAKEYLAKLTASGWLKELPPREATALEKEILGSFQENRSLAFYSLAVAGFDEECVEDKGDYVSVIEHLGENSRGLFRPKKITDNFDHKRGIARVSFQHDKKLYECKASCKNDWFQPEVFDLINDAIEATGVQQKFHCLPGCDQCAELALISKRSFSRAVKLGVIPDVEFYFPEDE